MAGLIDDLMGQLGAAGGDAGVGGLLGGLLGGGGDTDSSAKTEAATNMGIGAILGGLAKNTESKRGARSLSKALDRHDGSVLDDISGKLGQPETAADGEKILGHVFGKNQDAVTQQLAAKSGLDLGSIKKLLPMLAPVVMGMVAKKGKSGGAGNLAGMLGQESGGLDLGDLAGMLGGGGGGGLMGMLKGVLGGR